MSSRTSSPPLRIEARPSQIYLLLLIGLWSLALVTIFLATINVWLKPLLVLVLLAYGGLLWRGELRLKGPRAVRLALWDEKDQWRIQLGRGAMQGAELLPDSLNLSFLIILRFKTLAGSQYSLPLFRDSLEPDLHRRLRARLKVYAARLGSGEQG